MKLNKKIINDNIMFLPKGKKKGMLGYLKRWEKGADEREPCFMKILRKEVEPGMTVFEVGANVGYQTFAMLDSLKDNGQIIAFEPNPESLNLLRKNIDINNQGDMVKIFDNVISDFTGEIVFYVNQEVSNLSSIIKRKKTNKKIKVKSYSLSDFIVKYDIDYPNFIKMDIEGAEVSVMRGFYDILSHNKFPCKIIMEIHPSTYSINNDFREQLQNYFSIGFKVKYLVSATVKIPKQYKELGYKPIYDSPLGINRAIFKDVLNDHALKFICDGFEDFCPAKKKKGKIVRFLLIERKE